MVGESSTDPSPGPLRVTAKALRRLPGSPLPPPPLSHAFFSCFQIGHIEGDPERKGVFPMSFVHILSD